MEEKASAVGNKFEEKAESTVQSGPSKANPNRIEEKGSCEKAEAELKSWIRKRLPKRKSEDNGA